MSDLTLKLITDHAFCADEVRRLKKAGEIEASRCTHLKESSIKQFMGSDFEPLMIGTNCIERAWQELQRERITHPFENWQYDEIFEDMNPEPCDHCRKVRELRKERMRAIQRLGAVRAAITRVGRRLQAESTIQSEGES